MDVVKPFVCPYTEICQKSFRQKHRYILTVKRIPDMEICSIFKNMYMFITEGIFNTTYPLFSLN